MVETPLDNRPSGSEATSLTPRRNVGATLLRQRAKHLARLALGSSSDLDVPGEAPPEDPYLKNAGEWVEQYYEASYGVLPEDHPLTKYVASLNARFPKLNVKFKILPGWKEINAAALPNNTILLSAGLIKFCEHEEELMFVLGHERTHLKHHFQHRGKQMKSVKDLLKEIGHHRFAEYEADLRGVTEEMNKSGINPYGGKYFLERLAELETKEGEQKDLAHGSSLDRMLNISTATRLFDLRELAMDLTPWSIDPRFRGDDKSGDDKSKDLHNGIRSRLPAKEGIQWHIDKNLDYLRRSGKNAVLFGNDIYERLQKATAYAKDFPASLYALIDLQFTRDLFSIMQKNTDGMMHDLFPSFSAKEKEMFKVFMYHFVGGIPALSDMKLSSAFWDSIETEEDFEKLAAVCSLENFQKTGFFSVGNAEEWLHALLIHACELGLFGDGKEFNQKKYADFASKLCRQLESFSRSFGTAVFDPKKMEGLIHEVAEPSIGKDLSAPEARDSMEIQLDACVMDTIRNYPEPLIAKEGAEDHITQMKEYRQQCDAYLQSKIETFLAIRHFSTGKELTQYAAGFLKQKGEKLNIKETDICIKFIKRVWISMEPNIEKKFLVENFLNTLSPSVNYLFEMHENVQHTEQNLEHSARSLFDAIYRKEVWGIEEEEGKSDEEEIEKRKSDFIERYLIRYFESLPTKKALLAAMKKYESYGFDFSRGSEFVYTYSIGCQYFLAHIFKKHDFSAENLDATDIELLLLLSNLIVDVSRAMRLQSILLKKMTEGKSFDEEIDILLKNERTNSYGDVGMRDQWIETKSHTPDELHHIEDAAMKSLESWFHDEDITEYLGEWAFLDMIEGFWKEKITILLYLIQTQESDEGIKKYLLEKYRLHYYEKDETEKAAEQLVKCDAFLNSIWGLSAEMRYTLLRILLMGKDGVFRSGKSREVFLNKFLKTALTKNDEESDLRQLLLDIGPVLAEIDDPELFYFAFLPLLFRRFVRYPKQTVPWLQILKKAKIPQPKTIFRKYEKMTKRGSDELRDIQGYDSVHATAVNNFIDEKFLKPSESVEEEAPLSPLALIIEIAKSLGATGVRFLQLLGQYMKVPEGYESSFSDVYDQMRGQSKLAAYRLIKREWPDFAKTIKTMHPRVGGGSLMTVYEVETQSGDREVLKVLNPNVKFHLDRTFGFLGELVEALVEKFGPAYEPVRFALNDIREWITRDVTLDEFLADDKRFAIKNHGFRVEEGPESYRIGVPKTYEPENRYFIREEFVVGKNLTQWDELVAEGHDMRKVVSLLAKNYMAQIADGQAHADIHVGNIRIAADRTCYILDRAGYLKFDDEDKKLFVAFSIADRGTLCELATAYFRKSNDMPDLENRVAEAFSEMTSPQDLLLHLKKAQVKIPLKITLLMKNLSVLDIFAKKAGFTGLQEALAT